MIIGITGGTGCGKTTLLELLRWQGAAVLDCDEIYHQLLLSDREMLSSISDRFPGTVENGRLDRKKLGAIVFADDQALLDLNAITHGAVKQEVLRQLDAQPELAAIDAIGLFEGGLAELCDLTVAVTAPPDARMARLMARDGISEEYARSRIAAQHNDDWFRLRCDRILENNGTKAAFEAKCLAFFHSAGIIERKPCKGELPMNIEELRESLMSAPKNGLTTMTAEQRADMESYCKRYSVFMDACKTEREATAWTAATAEAHGFKPAVPGMEVNPGDKIYLNNRGKSILLAVIGSEPLSAGANICAAHVDSPRLDVKPHPLYEDSEIAYLKTHYFGGVKKYQWVCTPLAIHGVVCLKDGSSVTVTIGEDDNDPVLMISDLLIHLSRDQMQKPAAKVIEGEQLNVILGTEPLEGEGADLTKLHILKLLNEKYGMIEDDFHSAELTIVPAGKCREVGLDRSLLAAYGHDDRVCAFAEIEPLLNMGTPKHTAVCILADREEVGSIGISGMKSQAFEYFIGILCEAQGVNLRHCFANSFCLSADVSNAFDPNFPETCDKRNNSRLNYGVAICKYTGSGGKGGASDAAAEVWQSSARHIPHFRKNTGRRALYRFDKLEFIYTKELWNSSVIKGFLYYNAFAAFLLLE